MRRTSAAAICFAALFFASAIFGTATASAQQFTRTYSIEQSTLVSSSSGVATGYYTPGGRIVTAYGVPAGPYLPPSPPSAYMTFYAPGGTRYYAPPSPCPGWEPRNRLSGW
jgi:hypothetical protein